MINEKLKDLYVHYYGEDYESNIIPCGVVDEKAYLSSKPRIVFVLKEPHSEGLGWSIPNSLINQVEEHQNGLEKKFAYTWNQAGIWAYAIHNGFRNYLSFVNLK
jgi:hypothetical protein